MKYDFSNLTSKLLGIKFGPFGSLDLLHCLFECFRQCVYGDVGLGTACHAMRHACPQRWKWLSVSCELLRQFGDLASHPSGTGQTHSSKSAGALHPCWVFSSMQNPWVVQGQSAPCVGSDSGTKQFPMQLATGCRFFDWEWFHVLELTYSCWKHSIDTMVCIPGYTTNVLDDHAPSDWTIVSDHHLFVDLLALSQIFRLFHLAFGLDWWVHCLRNTSLRGDLIGCLQEFDWPPSDGSLDWVLEKTSSLASESWLDSENSGSVWRTQNPYRGSLSWHLQALY